MNAFGRWATACALPTFVLVQMLLLFGQLADGRTVDNSLDFDCAGISKFIDGDVANYHKAFECINAAGMGNSEARLHFTVKEQTIMQPIILHKGLSHFTIRILGQIQKAIVTILSNKSAPSSEMLAALHEAISEPSMASLNNWITNLKQGLQEAQENGNKFNVPDDPVAQKFHAYLTQGGLFLPRLDMLLERAEKEVESLKSELGKLSGYPTRPDLESTLISIRQLVRTVSLFFGYFSFVFGCAGLSLAVV